jgi:hypothetical protein
MIRTDRTGQTVRIDANVATGILGEISSRGINARRQRIANRSWLQSFQETIMSMTSNQNQNFLPDEDENEEPERELDHEPEEGGAHVPNTSTEPRIKNN